MNKIKALFIAIMLAVGLVSVFGSGTALASAPSVWYYGDHNSACHEVDTTIGYAGNCIWSSQWPDFILDGGGGAIGTYRFAYRAVDKGNLVGGRIGYPGYWMQSYTAGLVGSTLELQRDCNVVVYAPNHVPKWSAGTYISDGKTHDCRLVMDQNNHGTVWVQYKVGTAWWSICAIPSPDYINGGTCPHYQGTLNR